MLAGYIGMMIATSTNVKVTYLCNQDIINVVDLSNLDFINVVDLCNLDIINVVDLCYFKLCVL